MKVLCTTMPTLGHFHPLVPLARALATAGHPVAFATADDFRRQVSRAGFDAFAAGLSEPALEAELRRLPAAENGVPVERQRRRIATEVAPPAMLPDLLRIIDEWRPDVLVHEEGEFTAPLAAALRGIPAAIHGWPAPTIGEERARRIGAALAPLWKARGVEPEALGGLFRHLHLDCCPPSLQGKRVVESCTVRSLRPIPYDANGGNDVPPGLGSTGRPLVYVTLGTVPAFNRAPEIFALVIEALRDERLDLIVTVGPNNDPRMLGSQPSNVRVERYVPQSSLLPQCDVVVCHGGACRCSPCRAAPGARSAAPTRARRGALAACSSART
jgi:UDP:flavonoid glycosyltransferase YjiC (YdhE family)